MIGGFNGRYNTGSTRIYDLDLQFLREGPSLNVPRFYHDCTVVQSANHEGRTILIVVGGQDGKVKVSLKSIEVWDQYKPGTSWQKCKTD